MAGYETLTIGASNLGACVVKSKRIPIIDNMVKHRTISGQDRYQNMFDTKYEYTFDCYITVAQLTALYNSLGTYPMVTVTYRRTDWNISTGKLCYVEITDEDYEKYLSQPVNGVASAMNVDVSIKCVEVG